MQNKLMKSATLAAFLGSTSASITFNADGTQGNAPCMETYLAVCAECNEGFPEDAHAVHGLEASDGGLLAVGFGIGDSDHDGFAIKTNGGCTYDTKYNWLEADGASCQLSYEWMTKFTADGVTTKTLWMATSPDDSYIIVVGMRGNASTNKADQFIAKLDASDGSSVWEMTINPGSSGNAVLETIAFTSDGGFVVGGAIDNEWGIGEMIFKSSGIFQEATPYIAKISQADAEGSTAPTSYEWEYSYDWSSEEYTGSARSLRVDSSDNVWALVASATLVQLDSSGNEVFETAGNLVSDTQLNDLELINDGVDGVMFTGHTYGTSDLDCRLGSCGTITGTMVKADSSGGNQGQWFFNNYPGGLYQYYDIEEGDERLIYTECWGIAKSYDSSGVHDGYVMACGTGIEGCGSNRFKRGLKRECRADPRKNWRDSTIATDLDGAQTWGRLDNFYDGGNKVATSAAEYVFPLAAGGHAIVTDELMGLGFGIIAQYDDVKCTEEDSSDAALGLIEEGFFTRIFGRWF